MAAGTTAATAYTAPTCDCLSTQRGVSDAVAQYAQVAVSQLSIVRDALTLARTLEWSGSAGDAFHTETESLSPMVESYENDIAGVCRMCG